MGRKKEKKESEKEDDDAKVLYSTAIRKCERLAAADAAAAAATNVAAAAAAPAAAAPTATATDALPDIVPKGRFKGYVSPDNVNSQLGEYKERMREHYNRIACEAFDDGEDQVVDAIPMLFMRWHKMLNEIRSKRTDAPSETAAIAAAAAAADTSAVAAAAAAATTTNAAATTIARLEHELGEMAAAAAAATAATRRRRHETKLHTDQVFLTGLRSRK